LSPKAGPRRARSASTVAHGLVVASIVQAAGEIAASLRYSLI